MDHGDGLGGFQFIDASSDVFASFDGLVHAHLPPAEVGYASERHFARLVGEDVDVKAKFSPLEVFDAVHTLQSTDRLTFK